MIKPKHTIHFTLAALMLLFGSLVVLSDALTLVWPKIGIVGIALWLIMLAGMIVLSLIELTKLIKYSWQSKSPSTLLVIASLVGLVAYWSGSSKSLSGENTQEVACAIDHVVSKFDFGLHQTCLFGYPVRQYLPQVFSSIWFGRSLPVLAVGGSLYACLGMIWLGSSLWQAQGIHRKGDLLTAISLASLFHFYYFNEFLFYFEQGIFPISFALLLTAFGIQILFLKNHAFIGLATLTGFMAIHSYTPSLALLPLMLAGMGYLFAKIPSARMMMIWAGILLVISFGLSLLYRHDLQIGSNTARSYSQRLLDIKESTEHLVFANKGRPFASPFMTGLAILLVALIAGGIFGRHVLAVGVWAGLVLLISLIAKGYNFYQADFRVQRSLLVIPVVLTSVVLKMRPLSARCPIRFLLIIFLALFSYGVTYSFTQINSRSLHPHAEVIRQLTFFQQDETQSLLITAMADQANNLVSLQDTARYFLPSLAIRHENADAKADATCAQLAVSADLVLINSGDDQCMRSLKSGRLFKISSPLLPTTYVVWKP